MSRRLHHQNGRANAEWTYICSLPKDPTEIYYNLSPAGIRQLAVKQPTFDKEHRGMRLVTSSPNPGGLANYFYSSASLSQVVEITLCREEHSLIAGLLFRYTDGHRASVGEFRMDCIGETLQVDPRRNLLYLGFAKAEKVLPHVARLELSLPREMGSLRWLRIPWRGTLDWWFCFRTCKVYYGDQESP